MTACPACGERNPDIGRYCLACGSPLGTGSRGREERKVITVLFCDLVDFTARFDRADPEDIDATLAIYHDRVRREIERFDGTVEKFIGDAVMAVFGAPVSHEDDAHRAIWSALRILPAIDELNESKEGQLAVRIGIDTGEAVVSLDAERSRQRIATGDVVNTAARLQQAARTGGIVVGEATHRLAKDLFEFEALEPLRVKGKAEPIDAWEARSARSRFGVQLHRRPSTPWVDREDELELLKRSFARVVRESYLQLVTLLGEPGAGKSRLIREFFTYIDDLPSLVFWRQGRCLPYGEGVTYWALGEIVKAQAGILESDGAREAREKLAAAVAALVEEESDQEWIRARLAPLVGIAELTTETIERVEAFSAMRCFLEAMAAIHPLVMVVEDLHWADKSLLDFIEYLVDQSVGLPVLVLGSARPELFERVPSWGGGKRNSTTLSLPPLVDADTQRLVSVLLPPRTPAAVQEMLIERAGGNPLFAEEFARMLEDRPVPLERAEAAGPGNAPLPASVQAVIAARLDTLRTDQKSLLQDASVVGREFWPGVLVAIGGSDPDAVSERLLELTRKELVHPLRVSTVGHETEYAFWHPLVRDVAYSQIPRVPRARKHIAAARWIEQLAGERLADRADLLANHYGQALQLVRSAGMIEEARGLEEPTRRYWVLAGERALSLEVARAEECFNRALQLAPVGHAERPGVLARKAEAAQDAGRYADAETLYGEALEGFRELGDVRGEGACLERLAAVSRERGDTARCRSRLDDAVAVLEGLPPGPELVQSYASVAATRLMTGHFTEAVKWAERALRLAADIDADALVPRALSYQGMARCYLGDLAGMHDLDEALRMTESLGSSRENARVLLVRAEVIWATEGPNAALEAARSGAELAERRGLVDMTVSCWNLSLGPLFDLGRWDELLVLGADVIGWSGTMGGRYAALLAKPWKAQVLAWRGQFEQATSLGSELVIQARLVGEPQVLVPALAAAALAEWRQGRDREAVRLVEELDKIAEVGIGWYREQFIADLLRISAGTRNIPLAERLLQRAEVFAARHRGSLLSGKAAVKEAREELDAACDAYDEAFRGWTEYGHVLESGLASLGAGRCLSRMKRPGARERLLRARVMFEDLGAAGLVAEADEHLSKERGTRT